MRDASEARGIKRVAVLGGGIAGLSSAHQLVEWNRQAEPGSWWYEVTVFESRGAAIDTLGGKARSWRATPDDEPRPLLDRDRAGRHGLPGEHGFRFFPGFYQHVTQTMSEIPAPPGPTGEPRTVTDHLVALDEAGFYAEPAHPDAAWRVPARAQRLDRSLRRVWMLTSALWLAAPVALVVGAWSPWWFALWLAVGLVWKTARWAIAARAHDGAARYLLRVRTTADADAGERIYARLRRAKFRWWWLAALPLVLWWGPAVRVWILLGVLAIAWTFMDALMAGRWIWHDIRNALPHDVRPRALESLAGAFAVIQLVTSCRRRIDRIWEHRSWWEHSRAAQFSDRYKLSLATGLTRTFVATRAEAMSAKTGGLILAQLIYDLNPYLDRDRRSGGPRVDGADRILDGPTSEVWIEPWIAHLRAHGVQFNEFTRRSGERQGPLPKVLVQRLVLDATSRRIDGFRYNSQIACLPERPGDDPIPGNAELVGEFDHYVLAVSGTSAQWILGNSPLVTWADRAIAAGERPVHPLSAPEPVPHLDGIFGLEFGWMTGVVFHLDRVVDLPRGHMLLLDSEWALTLVDQRAHWSAEHRIPLDHSILSVDVSDWDSPSRRGTPAKLTDLDAVVAEVWAQIQRHVPQLADVPCPPRDRVIIDHAISDPEPAEQCINGLGAPRPGPRSHRRTMHGELENLPLTNTDRLLVNIAGTWANRPTATTAFANLFVAGDYVRTQVDFASMESADEAARWATHALTCGDHDGAGLPAPRGLADPPELAGILRAFRFLDRLLYAIGLANPAVVLAMPVIWFAKVEDRLRTWIERICRAPGLPPRGADRRPDPPPVVVDRDGSSAAIDLGRDRGPAPLGGAGPDVVVGGDGLGDDGAARR